jgi:hypothetical protein
MSFLDANAYQLLLTLHLLGLALGIGGATITDFTFLRALKERRVTPETIGRMKILSQVVWVGLGILALSGLGLFLLSPEYFLATPGFLAKMTVVLVLTINGLFLNFYATSRLTSFTFTDQYPSGSPLGRARKLSFLFGSISLVSWYTAFFVAMLKGVFPLPYVGYVIIYIVVATGAVLLGQIIERLLSREKLPSTIPSQPAQLDQNSATVSPPSYPQAPLIKTPSYLPQFPPSTQYPQPPNPSTGQVPPPNTPPYL